MAEVARVHSDRLEDLKKQVEEAQEYFKDNVERFEKFVKFVFKTSMTQDEITTLESVGKPTLEFNVLEAYISRLRGEFAKQQPALTVRAADGVPLPMLTPQFGETLDVVEAHLRAIFFDGTNDCLDYNVYTDLLAGGFSVVQVFTEYVNEKSFEQNIVVERVFEPTLTYFDPLSRKSHKGDGRYCGSLIPMTRSAFEDRYGAESVADMKFTRNLAGFSWSFKNEKEDIILVAEHFEKKITKETILKLSNGHTVTKKEYERFLKEWQEKAYIEQPPIPIQERKTWIEYIVRYHFCESKVLDHVETDFKYLPLVFVDGNSIILKDDESYEQMTRPAVYQAEGIQKLKNFAGQCLANELENSVQHKVMAAIEGVPIDYLDAYQNLQKSQTLLFKAFLTDGKGNPNTDIPLPPPQMIARTPIPPEITNTFSMTDPMTMVILGNNDNSQGVSSAPMSGVAFARSAIQTNNASVPYVVGFIKGLNRVAQIIVDLIPKYYRTPRSLPILLPNGKRSYQEINKKGSLYMNFDPNNLQVKVETGVNFSIQKEIALQTIIAMSQANAGFAAFFNEEGLPTLLDNIDIRGIDQLKIKAEGWMGKQKQIQAQQMQTAQQAQQMQMQQQALSLAQMQKEAQSPSQTQVEQMFIQQKAQLDNANLEIKARDSDTKFLEVMAKIQGADVDRELRAAELEAENMRSQIDSVIEISKHIAEANSKESKNE